MESRIYASTTSLHSVQQGLEASAVQHREELRQELEMKLLHYCREAEESAVRRMQEDFMIPQLQAYNQKFEVRLEDVEHQIKQLFQMVGELAEQVADLHPALRDLVSNSNCTQRQLADMDTEVKCSEEQLSALRNGVVKSVEELRAGTAEVTNRLTTFEQASEKLLCDLKGAAAAATVNAVERADKQYMQTLTEARSLQAEAIQTGEQQAAWCLNQAEGSLQDVFRHVADEICAQAEHQGQLSLRKMRQSEEHTEKCMSVLHEEFQESSHLQTTAAECLAQQELSELALRICHELDEERQQLDQVRQTFDKSLCDETGKVAARITETQAEAATHAQNFQDSLNQAGAARMSIRRELKVDRDKHQQARKELVQSGLQRHARLELNLAREVAQLRSELASSIHRSCEQTTALRNEVRTCSSEVDVVENMSSMSRRFDELEQELQGHHNQLEGTEVKLRSQLHDAQEEADQIRQRSQQEALVLGRELTELRAATSSLANGVVKALKVLGLVQSGPWVAASDGSHEHRNVEVEDLLRWEKTGTSLSSLIVWPVSRKSTAAPSGPSAKRTLLSSLYDKADSEDVAELKQFVHQALMIVSPVSLASHEGASATKIKANPLIQSP